MIPQATYERAIAALSEQVHERNEQIALLRAAYNEARAVIRDQERLIDLLRKVAADDRRN
jgi:hypothetical protein